MTMTLDKILREHGLIRENQEKKPEEVKEELARYLPAATAMNFKQTSGFTGIHLKKVHEFKRKLSSMTEEERDYVITMIMLDKTLSKTTGLPENSDHET